MSPDQLRDAIGELQTRLQEIETLDHTSISAFSTAAKSIASGVNRTLAKLFGPDAPEYSRCVITPSLFKPSNGGRGRPQRLAAFVSGKEIVASRIVHEIELLDNLLPRYPVTSPSYSINVDLPGPQTAVPLPLHGEGSFAAASTVVPAERIVISPTIYPQGTGGIVIVGQSITFNINSPELRDIKDNVDRVLAHLRGTNEASAEVRQQLTGELQAGMALTTCPKADRGAIDNYLLRPLRFIAKEFASGVIRYAASAALAALLTLLAGPAS